MLVNILLGGAAFALCAWTVLEFAYTRVKKARVEHLFCLLAIFLVAAVSVACLLAMLSVYSFSLTASILLVGSLCGKCVLYLRCRLPLFSFAWLRSAFSRLREIRISHVLLAVALAAVAFVYAINPTEYLFGGRDYGIYMLHGVHIAETGAVQYENDELVQEQYEEIKDFAQLEYMAFYSSYQMGLSDSPGQLNPQFLPLFPAALALGYSLLGMRGLLLVNPVLTILCLMALFFFARRFWGRPAAILATAFLAVCPAELWGARVTQSEQLAQLLFLLSAYCFAMGWQRKKESWFMACAALIGLGCFNRIDNYVLAIGLYAVACYAAIWAPSYLKRFYRPLLLQTGLGAVSVWYGFAFHPGYFQGHWRPENNTLQLLVLATAAVAAVTLVVLLLSPRLHAPLQKAEPLAFFSSRVGARLLCGAITLALLLCYFVRPHLEDSFNARNLVEFSWYTSFAAILLMVGGFYCMLRKKNGVLPQLYFLLCGLGSLAMYIAKPAISADHFWASRRWMPVIFPFILLLAAHAIVQLWRLAAEKRWLRAVKRMAACALAIYVGGFMVWQCRKFVFYPQLATIEEPYVQSAAYLPDDTLVFTSLTDAASVFHYVYGKDARTYQNGLDEESHAKAREGMRQYMEAHGEVYFIGFPGPFWTLGSVEQVHPQAFSEDFMIRAIGHYPNTLISINYDFGVYRLTAGETTHINLLDALAKSPYAKYDGTSIVMPQRGEVFGGPGMEMQPGSYRIEFDFATKGEVVAQLEVVTKNREQELYTLEILEDGTVTLEFEIEEYQPVISFVFTSFGGQPVTVTRAELFVL